MTCRRVSTSSEQSSRQSSSVLLREARAAPVAAHQVHQSVDAPCFSWTLRGQVRDSGRIGQVGDVGVDTGTAAISVSRICWLYSTATTVASAARNAAHTGGPGETGGTGHQHDPPGSVGHPVMPAVEVITGASLRLSAS